MGNAASPFAGIYKRLEDASAYLERIGYTGEISHTQACLNELMKCQLESVPFENLDVFHRGVEPSLETDAMFEKIVTNRRGGYCFELNGLFWRLLEALGFTAHCAAARIALGRDFLAPPAHRVVIVELDGKRLFCDVGFGGPIHLSPIEIECGKNITCAAGRRYRFEHEGDMTVLFVELDGAFVPMLRFSDVACDPVDFVPLNTFCAKSEIEPFMHRQMLWRLGKEGRCSIDGDILRIKRGDEVSEKRLTTEAELREALKEHFGMVYPYPLREWRSE